MHNRNVVLPKCDRCTSRAAHIYNKMPLCAPCTDQVREHRAKRGADYKAAENIIQGGVNIRGPI